MISSTDKTNVFWGKKLWVTILPYLARLGKNSKQHWLVFPKLHFFTDCGPWWERRRVSWLWGTQKKVLGATSHELRLGFLWGLSYQPATDNVALVCWVCYWLKKLQRIRSLLLANYARARKMRRAFIIIIYVLMFVYYRQQKQLSTILQP